MNEMIMEKGMDEKSLREISIKLGDSTPSYVFSMDILTKRIEMLQKKRVGNVRLCYAMKANPFLVKPLSSRVDYFEVCSPGELSICKENCINPEKVVFSGINKRKEEILDAVRFGVAMITLESVQQYVYVKECARKLHRKIKIMPRLTGGGQFGMDKEELEDIIIDSQRADCLEVVGVHYFTGTQKRKVEKIIEEARFLKEYCDDLKIRLGFSAEILEFGTGMAVPYFIGDDFDGEYLAFDRLMEFLRTEGENYQWTLEFGRYIAASCGFYFTSVVDRKINHGIAYCLVDGGIHHLNYIGQNMAMRVPVITHIKKNIGSGKKEKTQEWSVCGSLCTFADILVRKAEFMDLDCGDVLVFQNAGAYAVTEAIYLLLSRKMPRIYFYSEQGGLQLKRDWLETFPLNNCL